MARPILWAGVDAGKVAHHCVAINADGQRMLSRRVVNDEAALIDLIRAVKKSAGGGSVRWAIDLNSGGCGAVDHPAAQRPPGPALRPRTYRASRLRCLPWRRQNRCKDAAIIADQARMRKDFHPFRDRDKTAVDLRILCARRNDLASDRNRAINRLRAQLLEYFPALVRAFEFAHRKGALILLTGYQTPSPLWRHLAASKSIKTCPESRTTTTASDLRTTPFPGRPVPRATAPQRPVGYAPRQHQLPTRITTRRLTISLRLTVTS